MGRHLVPQIVWWIACVVTIATLRDAPFSERNQPITMEEASEIALEDLQRIDRGQYGDFVVVNAAFSSSGELGLEPRWVVLCDAEARTGLREAVAIEIDSEIGRVLRIRKGLRRIASR